MKLRNPIEVGHDRKSLDHVSSLNPRDTSVAKGICGGAISGAHSWRGESSCNNPIGTGGLLAYIKLPGSPRNLHVLSRNQPVSASARLSCFSSEPRIPRDAHLSDDRQAIKAHYVSGGRHLGARGPPAAAANRLDNNQDATPEDRSRNPAPQR